ncbi:MAG TPA: sensor domain-containing diguanylate cyclase [Vicinamibacterales bacterium]|nr:sensor domain-containing diguanylate cyclase [Vicinamibacterales bacterium]
MPPSPGVRPDLATRLRQSQRALKGRLGKPETHLALMRAAHDTLDPEKIGDLVIERAIEWLKASSCAVLAADLDGQIIPVAGRSLGAGLAAAAADVGKWVINHGREFATADLRRDARVEGACGAVVAVPLRCRARTVGALVVLDRLASSVEPKLGAGVGELLTAALEGPAVALVNALTLKRAEALSVTDDLTQLYNSRYLNQVLRREAKRASRSGRPLALLFVDLDGFKAVNDTHGHLAGSKALVEAAAVIRRCARETDVVARFGGDEFSLILPDTGSEGAAAVGERLRERVAEHPFLATDGLDIHLTVSVGVATLPDVAASAEELVKAADTAMYRVKESGKNGVFIARGDFAAD